MQLAGSDVLILGTVVAGTASVTATLTWFMATQFSITRKLIHELHEAMSRRVTRIEYHLVKRDGYQPAADTVAFSGSKRTGH